MDYLTTGNIIVDEVSKINFSGDITPRIWRKTITKENGKPYALARDILSDFVYWYRAIEEPDEKTGEIRLKKKFRDDLLYKSYEQLCEEFGESKRVIRDVLKRLEDIGVIKRHFRTVTAKSGMKMNNVMYIEVVPSVLYELTYPEKSADIVDFPQEKSGETTENRDSLPPIDENVNRVVTKMLPRNPENTTEIINNYNTSHPSIRRDTKPQGELRMDGTRNADKGCIARSGEPYSLEKIKEWYDYDSLCLMKPEFRQDIDCVINLLYDTLNTTRRTIRVLGEEKPKDVVISRLLKLDSMDLFYAIEQYQNQTTRIRHQQSYLLTVLYQAKGQSHLDIGNQVKYHAAKRKGEQEYHGEE
ncbi:MAG: DUF6017 domain-containing protein [Roseburia sp.]|nr:DUF6017 domain-containing protein [Roseburia sp.]